MLFFLWSLFKGQSAVLPWEGNTVMVLGKKQRTDEKAPACLINYSTTVSSQHMVKTQLEDRHQAEAEALAIR